MSCILHHAPGTRDEFLIDSTPYSCGLYEIGVGIVREANANYCCERCDGPTGPLLDDPTGHYVGWDIGSLVSVALDEYGAAQLVSSTVKLPANADLEVISSTVSRPALLALFTPRAVS